VRQIACGGGVGSTSSGGGGTATTAGVVNAVRFHPLNGNLLLVGRAAKSVWLVNASTGRVALTPGGCQICYMCDQNSTYGLHSLPGGVRFVTYMAHTGCHRLNRVLAGVRWVTRAILAVIN
jgi:hypothetical protein